MKVRELTSAGPALVWKRFPGLSLAGSCGGRTRCHPRRWVPGLRENRAQRLPAGTTVDVQARTPLT